MDPNQIQSNPINPELNNLSQPDLNQETQLPVENSPVEEKEKPFSKLAAENNPFKQIASYFINDQTRKTYTLLSVTFAFIGVLIFFAILPTLLSISQVVKKIDEYKTIQDQQSEKLATLESLRQQAEDPISQNGLNEPIKFLDETFIPSTPAQEPVYNDLILKIKKANVGLESIKTSTVATETEKVKSALFQINIKSDSYSNIQAFMDSLSKSQILYKIQQFSMSAPDDSKTQSTSSNKSYTANIIISSYYYV